MTAHELELLVNLPNQDGMPGTDDESEPHSQRRIRNNIEAGLGLSLPVPRRLARVTWQQRAMHWLQYQSGVLLVGCLADIVANCLV